MNKKTAIIIILLIVSPIIIYFLWPSDEVRIKKLFKEGAAAIETEKIDDVMSKVSYNYTDEYGMTYLYIKELMTRIFERLSNIEIEYVLKNIEIRKDNAIAQIELRVIATSGNDTGYIIGDASRPVLMKFHLSKERTKWMVTSMEGFPLNF